MKIDLHCHTIKAKSGDGGRDIDPVSLAEVLAGSGVGIAAITNHNLFDLAKFNQCTAAALLRGLTFGQVLSLTYKASRAQLAM